MVFIEITSNKDRRKRSIVTYIRDFTLKEMTGEMKEDSGMVLVEIRRIKMSEKFRKR